MKRLLGILIACALLASCQVRPAAVRPLSPTGGSLFVYLEPFPAESSRVTFRISAVAATNADGRGTPLDLLFQDAGTDRPGRTRLLARGAVPPGSYSGLSLAIGDATLSGVQGDVKLQPAEQTATIEIPFTIERRGAAVLSVALRPGAPITETYRFAPGFTGTRPAKPASGVTGLATTCDGGTLTVFDKTSGQVVAVIPAGRSPRAVDVDRPRLRAYVALSREDAVEVIDLQQYRAVERVQLFGGDHPVELALTPDAETLLVVNEGSDTLSFVEPSSLSERRRVSVGNGPTSVVVDRSGRRAFVFNTLSNSISVIDVDSAGLITTLATEAAPLRGQLNRDGDRLYVIHGSSPNLAIYDTQSLSLAANVYVGPGATALKVDPRTDRIYVARKNALEIDIYDPFSLLPVDSILSPGDVTYMTIDDEGNNLALVVSDLAEVRILRLVSKDPVARVDIGGEPCWTTFLGER